MKIAGESKYKNNGNIDYMDILSEMQEKYSSVYMCRIEDIVFIYRALGRKEYRDLLKADLIDLEKEDVVCEACTLYPEDFDFSTTLAGIPSELCKEILENSFLDSLDSKKNVVTYFRNQMTLFDNQVNCIISEAFPSISMEEIETWDMIKTSKYLAQSEWKLNILRQVPMDIDVFNQMLEIDWYNDHPEEYKELVTNSKLNNNTNENLEFKPRETLEERQSRMQNNNGLRKKTKAEIAELKRKYPEINWDVEVDPNKNIEEMRDIVDTTPVALRAGY